MPASELKNSQIVELVQDGVKFKLDVTRHSPGGYFMVVNDSCAEVDTYRFVTDIYECTHSGSSLHEIVEPLPRPSQPLIGW